jgi:prepilin-type N-terminal cleavage/methylation domain-containing protein
MRRTSATSRVNGIGADQSGFTLIELLVVLAILAFATGWVAVRAGAFLGGNVGTAVADARRALVNCRIQAQVAGLPVLCKVDPVARRIGSVTLKGSPDRVELGGGTTDGSVLFYPTGEASPARILIARGTEEKYLDISPVTGRVRVLADDAI